MSACNFLGHRRGPMRADVEFAGAAASAANRLFVQYCLLGNMEDVLSILALSAAKGGSVTWLWRGGGGGRGSAMLSWLHATTKCTCPPRLPGPVQGSLPVQPFPPLPLPQRRQGSVNQRQVSVSGCQRRGGPKLNEQYFNQP